MTSITRSEYGKNARMLGYCAMLLGLLCSLVPIDSTLYHDPATCAILAVPLILVSGALLWSTASFSLSRRLIVLCIYVLVTGLVGWIGSRDETNSTWLFATMLADGALVPTALVIAYEWVFPYHVVAQTNLDKRG
ncbi:MAG: hypothetical protein JWN38_774 [Candidatus Saccharibacteria bacterium]|nr:hypothetical protein [Candidatus Saccharibacteria bacterium]